MKRVINDEVYMPTINHKDLRISDIVGFLLDGDTKGYFVYTGDCNEQGTEINSVTAVCVNRSDTAPNSTLSRLPFCIFKQIPPIGHKFKDTSFTIEEMYVFDTPEELHKWLSE